MTTFDQIRMVLDEVLQLGPRRESLTPQTILLGGLPEFDSMAVANVVAGIEERFDVIIEDDELTEDTFRTVGSLTDLVQTKLVA